MPPHIHLIEEPLVPTIVRNQLRPLLHEELEGAFRRFDDHDPWIEDDPIISCGWNLREVEEEIEIAKDDDVGVDEDDLVVVGQLP